MFSCKNDYLVDTEVFSKYLKSEFNMSIQEEGHCYILIPEFGCNGCMIDVLEKIGELINDDNKSLYTFIASNESVIPENLKIQVRIYYDKNRRLDNLSYEIANVTIVKTAKGEVIYTHSINLDESNEVESIIRF